MRLSYFPLIFISFLLYCCGTAQSGNKNPTPPPDNSLIDPKGGFILTRFKTPPGFERTIEDVNSFAFYLRNLPLKPNGTKVKLYNGEIKKADVYDAVVDLDIGDRDLEQCADAVIRLRAEYFFAQKQFDKISFRFTNGFVADYKQWMNGNRIIVNGNKVYWSKRESSSNDYKSFRNYLDVVFNYAGTLSLSESLTPKDIKDIAIGDIFIKGGSPGHAVIVVDMATDPEGKKIFMLAQSYMPAQDIHVLKNLNETGMSPWYSANISDNLLTPQWTFSKDELKSF